MGRLRVDPRSPRVRHDASSRRDEWIDAGIFEQLRAEALAAFDRIIGLDLDDVALLVPTLAIIDEQGLTVDIGTPQLSDVVQQLPP